MAISITIVAWVVMDSLFVAMLKYFAFRLAMKAQARPLPAHRRSVVP